MEGLNPAGIRAGAKLFAVRNGRPEPTTTKAEQRKHVEATLTERTLQRRADLGDEESLSELDRRASRADITSALDHAHPADR